MVKRILSTGVSAKYLLMDSWFAMPAIIVFMRYMFLAYQCRMETDHRTFGDLFYTCLEEAADISFMQALFRILTLADDQLKQLGAFGEKAATAFFDAIMDTALQCVGFSNNKLVIV